MVRCHVGNVIADPQPEIAGHARRKTRGALRILALGRDDNGSLRNGGKTRLDDADAVKPVRDIHVAAIFMRCAITSLRFLIIYS